MKFLKNCFGRALHIFQAAFKGFIQDTCYLHASSLTFYTLLSIVPILAVAFGLAKGFGFERNLEQELYQRFSEQREVVDQVVDFARSLLQQAENSYITGIGVVFLFLFVISLFWTIEASMNAIWKVKRSRAFLRIITDYLAMMVLLPIFFVIASSLIVFVTTQIGEAVEQNVVLKETMSPLLFLASRGITLVMIWIIFTCLYIIMPNTRVKTKYALFAGIFTGTVYYFVLIAIINFQIGVSQYNAIYGSFAALPLFLFWLQISWILVLFGAEIAYHAEHLSPTFKFSEKKREVKAKTVPVLLAYKIVEAFKKGNKPWDLKSLSNFFGLPEQSIQDFLHTLAETGLITEYRSDNDFHYLPAKDIKNIHLNSILKASNPLENQIISIKESKNLERISEKIREYEEDISSLKTNIALYQLEGK